MYHCLLRHLSRTRFVFEDNFILRMQLESSHHSIKSFTVWNLFFRCRSCIFLKLLERRLSRLLAGNFQVLRPLFCPWLRLWNLRCARILWGLRLLFPCILCSAFALGSLCRCCMKLFLCRRFVQASRFLCRIFSPPLCPCRLCRRLPRGMVCRVFERVPLRFV